MRAPIAVSISLLLSGCAGDIDDFNQVPELSPVGSGIVASAAAASLADDPIFTAPDGSWVGGSADLFRDIRGRRSGDIITVKIAIDDKAALNNVSNRSREANAGGSLGFTYDLMGAVGADINGVGNVDSSSSASGQGSTVRSEKVDLSIAAIVTSVLPNGDLVIEGSQEIVVNFEQRTLHVAGIVHPADITPENTVSYERIAEARIAYGGNGRLTEVQQPRWLQQAWDRVAPF
jgi:flagellar L-ring protein precursor FlgH